jgi:two-component system sensor kinase FixL
MDGQGLFDAIADSAILLDKAGRIINWNAGAAALFGYARKEVVGRSINLIYDRNYAFPKIIQDLHSHQKKWQEETTIIHKNGVKGHCHSYLSPIPSAHSNNKMSAILIHHNINPFKKIEDEPHHSPAQPHDALTGSWGTNLLLIELLNSLEQAERRYRESELRFHLLAENATDVISRHTPDGIYLYISPACKPSIGYNQDDLIGSNIHKLIHHDDLAKIKKAFTRRRDDLNSKPIVYRLKRKEGEYRWFESNIRLISDTSSRVISEIQLASRDITDRVLDKKARLRGQQLAHVFRLSTMEEMASGMAHEISQPLAAIVNYTRGCVRHLENTHYDRDQLRSVMGKAVAQAERAGEIVQRLKNFFCKGQLIKTSCKLNNIIRETASLIKNELTVSKTKLDFHFDKDIPFVFIDKIQIQQVTLNLIQNAIESMNVNHTKEKRIQIHTKSNKNTIEATITDAGPGFSKEIIHKAFTPFFTTKANGRGMGLAICRSIIEAHGGQFTINPNTNGHSWIRFSLPISI